MASKIKRQLTSSTIERVTTRAMKAKQLTSISTTTTSAMKANELTSTTIISDLPDELLSLILSKLSLEDKLRYECVCKLWQNVIYEHVDKVKFYETQKQKPKIIFRNWCGENQHLMGVNDLVLFQLLPLIL